MAFIGVKGNKKRVAASAGGNRKKKTAPGPYSLWSGIGRGGGKEGRLERSLPLWIVTFVRRVLHYVTGTSHRSKTWMAPFSLLDGTPAKGALLLLIVSPDTKASGLHKAYQQNVPCALFVLVCLRVDGGG